MSNNSFSEIWIQESWGKVASLPRFMNFLSTDDLICIYCFLALPFFVTLGASTSIDKELRSPHISSATLVISV